MCTVKEICSSLSKVRQLTCKNGALIIETATNHSIYRPKPKIKRPTSFFLVWSGCGVSLRSRKPVLRMHQVLLKYFCYQMSHLIMQVFKQGFT